MDVKIFIFFAAVFALIACSGDKNSSNTTSMSGGGNINVSISNANATSNIDTNVLINYNETKKYVCTGGGEIRHGYKLPPCPDPAENDKTLLGIDTNKNGVRDDVEVWIYNTYDTYKNCTKTKEVVTDENDLTYFIVHTNCTDEDIPYHQIVREIAMQQAKAYQIVMQDPTKARETTKYEENAQYCEFYFINDAKRHGDPTLFDNYDTYDELRKVQLNTIKRARAYGEYNFYLSGGAYGSPKVSYKTLCDFDVDKLLKK
ncbi:MAG: hypothetical protein LBT96_03450 [Campylobacteraceae bacterium]|nr:hypothetical protein [Campylobacteraceae bacterium]